VNSILLMKIACLLGVLVAIVGAFVTHVEKTSTVRPATVAEKKIVTTKMTGWGDTFAKHK
jgi:hypothetical protein